MPDVTLLTWNIRNFGPSKLDENETQLFDYVATVIDNADADIVSIIEVANSVLDQIATGIINSLDGLSMYDDTPWRHVSVNNNFNEAYLILYRIDRTFLPLRSAGAVLTTGPDVVPDHGLTNQDILGANTVAFPRPGQRRGGRKPFYCAFRTNAMPQKIFTVIAYHAMFGIYSGVGVESIPELDRLNFLDNAPTNTAVNGCLMSGDFNVDYDPAPTWWYHDILSIPSTNATAEKTTLKTGGDGSNNPVAYRSMAYDNVFQKIPVGGVARAGTVIDLMVQSSILDAPIAPLPAYVGDLAYATGMFDSGEIPNNYALDPVEDLPTPNMQQAWAFVIEAISNHYPVVVTTTF